MYESEKQWREVDRYFIDQLAREDDALVAARTSAQDANLPNGEVAPNQGKLLALLCQMIGAKRVLEIGTLAAYSTIWLAQAVGEHGAVTTLEISPIAAAVARKNIDAAGLATRVDLIEGAAGDSLRDLISRNVDAYDFIFIDADKPNNLAYLNAALRLSHVGTVIVGDNVVRDGAVADQHCTDDRVIGSRELIEEIGRNSRLTATALQTVGVKGWDGFVLALVTS